MAWVGANPRVQSLAPELLPHAVGMAKNKNKNKKEKKRKDRRKGESRKGKPCDGWTICLSWRHASPGGILIPETWVLRLENTRTEDKSWVLSKWGSGVKTPA